MEAALIGRLVVGYGEMDISMVIVAGKALGLQFPLLDAIEEVYSERSRIELIRKLSSAKLSQLGLNAKFEQALLATDTCREIRNHYAHCHYGDFGDGLLTVKAKSLFSIATSASDLPWRRISVATLTVQADFFSYARACWLWLDHATSRALKGKIDFYKDIPVQQPPRRDDGPLNPNPSRTVVS